MGCDIVCMVQCAVDCRVCKRLHGQTHTPVLSRPNVDQVVNWRDRSHGLLIRQAWEPCPEHVKRSISTSGHSLSV